MKEKKHLSNALKVQDNLAQGNALGCKMPYFVSPCKGRISEPSPLGWAKIHRCFRP